jgi:hypothetical protein
MKCNTCQRELREGMNVFEVQEGVIGISEFVALDEKLLFCRLECLKNYFSGSRGYEQAPRRIP